MVGRVLQQLKFPGCLPDGVNPLSRAGVPCWAQVILAAGAPAGAWLERLRMKSLSSDADVVVSPQRSAKEIGLPVLNQEHGNARLIQDIILSVLACCLLIRATP